MALIEDNSLRDKTRVFRDRADAGRLLSRKLLKYKDTDALILTIPSGGVPIGFELSKALGLPMDLIIVRKIQIPGNTEAGFGAMDPDGEIILNERLLDQIGLTGDEMIDQIEATGDIIGKRDRLFREGRPFPTVADKVVLLVDDGLASGYTTRAAIRFVRRNNPAKIVIAVPTAPKRTVDFLLPEVDELVCLNVRSGHFFAVADAYENWHDVTDEEVLRILGKGRD